MKERSPRAGKPVHLPVLTEVVPMQETVPGALMVTPMSAPQHPAPASAADGADVLPAWLLKNQGAPAPNPSTGAASLPAFQGRIATSPPASPASAFASSSWWNTDSDPEWVPSVSAALPASSQGRPSLQAKQAPTDAVQRLTQTVLAELEPELASKFEHRMREAMIPVMARAADVLMEELRRELSVQMREMVELAVARALAR